MTMPGLTDSTMIGDVLKLLMENGLELNPGKGPKAYGFIVALLLAACAAMMAYHVWRRKRRDKLEDQEKEARQKSEEKREQEKKEWAEKILEKLEGIVLTVNGHDKRIERNAWSIDQHAKEIKELKTKIKD